MTCFSFTFLSLVSSTSCSPSSHSVQLPLILPHPFLQCLISLLFCLPASQHPFYFHHHNCTSPFCFFDPFCISQSWLFLPPLSIELQVQEQPPEVRSGIYSHMEAFVPCNKEALLKRMKKLSLNIQVSEASLWKKWEIPSIYIDLKTSFPLQPFCDCSVVIKKPDSGSVCSCALSNRITAKIIFCESSLFSV